MQSKINKILRNDESRRRIIGYLDLPLKPKATYSKFVSEVEMLSEIGYVNYNLMCNTILSDYELLERDKEDTEFSFEHIVSSVGDYLESHKEWVDFKETDFKVDIEEGLMTSPHSLYLKKNSGKCYISLDLKAANWQSVKRIMGWDKELDYDTFIEEFTGDYILPRYSKSFRGKVFTEQGKLINYNKKLVVDNLKSMIEILNRKMGFKLTYADVKAIYADEALIEVTSDVYDNWNELDARATKMTIFNEIGLDMHVTCFRLQSTSFEKATMRIDTNNHIEMKMLSSDMQLIMDRAKHGYPLSDDSMTNAMKKKYSEEDIMEMAFEIMRDMRDVQDVEIENSLRLGVDGSIQLTIAKNSTFYVVNSLMEIFNNINYRFVDEVTDDNLLYEINFITGESYDSNGEKRVSLEFPEVINKGNSQAILIELLEME